METIERLEWNPEGEPIVAPVLFVHGLFLRASAWTRTAGRLRDAHGLRSVAISLPGHGGSSMHKGELDYYNVEDYVNPIARVIERMDERPVVVAHGAAALFVRRLLEEREHASHQTQPFPALALVAPMPVAGLGPWLARYRGRHRLHALTKRPAANPARFFDDARRARTELLAKGDATPETEWFAHVGSESRQVIEQLERGVKLLQKRFQPRARVFAPAGDAWFERGETATIERDLGADVVEVAGAGHAAMLGAGAEPLADALAAWCGEIRDGLTNAP
ncbi:MAG: alpha/beta hydrolase [Planctomycetota bacterium]